MSSIAVVGIGAGIGALFLCAACFVLLQIYRRKREHNREIAEIEEGFPPAQPIEVAHTQGLNACQLPFMQSYMQCGGWGALPSSESVHTMPAFAQVDNRTHPAFVFPPDQTRTGWHFPGRRPRIGRMPSKARRLQALSAIMESPKGATPTGGSRNSPAPTKAGADSVQSGESDQTEQSVAKLEMVSISPQIPLRLSSRPSQLNDTLVPTESLSRELSRPRTTRSKSLGTVSEPNKPNRITTFAVAPSPAPSGPLPPLPPLPRNINRHNDYDPANRHSALGIPSTQIDSTSTSLASSPERNWERIISLENATSGSVPKGEDNARDFTESPANGGAETMRNETNCRPKNTIGHRRSLVCLSIASNGSNRNSASSLASTLERQLNRLSIPQIITVDRVSMSRVSSSGSLSSSNNGGVTVVSKPKRRAGPSRVSASGSPGENHRTSALRMVSGNACTPQRPMRTPGRNTSMDLAAKAEKTVLAPKHSILKGSPSARKRHRRQNCVRLSTLAPTVLGPKSRSPSPTSMNEILEESPDSASKPIAERHMNGDVTLRPRTNLDPLRLRASLTPSSPTLSMVAYQHEHLQWSASNSRRVSFVLQQVKSPLSREASLSSIPSLPSVSCELESEPQGYVTPSIQFTRPSSEWSEGEHSPPFSLHVTPTASKGSCYDPESSSLPSWSRGHDPTWSMLEMAPFPSGQVYDPARPISVYSSADEDSSSPNFPFALKNNTAMTSCAVPSQFPLEEHTTEGGLQWLDDDKENLDSPPATTVDRLRSPFDSMPVLQPHSSMLEGLDASLPSPPSSPCSSICKTPPLLCRNNSNASTTRQDRHSFKRHHRRSSSSSPHRRGGGIEKAHLRNKRVAGPRTQPPKDIRKSIMALRRMNSEMHVSDDEMGRGSRRYLRMGREASPDIPFDFDFSREASDVDDDPPHDILVEEQEEEDDTKEYRCVTYSPPKPTLNVLTTLPEATRVPKAQLTVWDAGEAYWDEQEKRVTEAVTASPVDTPTNVLDRMLGVDDKHCAQLGSGKGGVKGIEMKERQDLASREKRKSRALGTPKSTRSLYDQQGFLCSP